MEQTAQDEVREREQHREPPREAGESAMLPDDAVQTGCHGFRTLQVHDATVKAILMSLAEQGSSRTLV
jgi:hypothetical protein